MSVFEKILTANDLRKKYCLFNSGGNAALIKDGQLYTVGYNLDGQLGLGSTVSRSSFIQVSLANGKIPVQVALGGTHIIVLCSDGTVQTAGGNSSNQLGRTGTTNIFGEVNLQGRYAIGVGAGYSTTFIILDDGGFLSFGSNNAGQLGNGSTTGTGSTTIVNYLSNSKNAIQVSGGFDHTLILTSDGLVYSCGGNQSNRLGYSGYSTNPTPTQITGLSEIAFVEAGQNHSCALTKKGVLFTFGSNSQSQLGRSTGGTVATVTIGSNLSVISVGAGNYHTIVLTSSGTYYGFGENGFGQISNAPAGITPTLINATKLGSAVTAGSYTSAIINTDMTIIGFGKNDYGELSLSTSNNVSQTLNTSVIAPTLTPLVYQIGSYTISQLTAGISVNTILSVLGTNYSDTYSSVKGIAITYADTTYGSWHYRLSANTFYQPFPTINISQALFLDSNTTIQFRPITGYLGAVIFKFKACRNNIDSSGTFVSTIARGGSTAFSTTTASLNLTITNTNDAPSVSGTYTFPTILEDNTSSSVSVNTIIDGITYTDPDTSALKGIAITSIASTIGTWRFSINGGSSWSNITASSSASLLLTDSTSNLISFVPNANANGTATFTFRGWDQTSGTNGTTANTSTNGRGTAFSSSTTTSSITVSPVNDLPTLSGTVTIPSINEDEISIGVLISSIISQVTITDIDSTTFGLGISVIDNTNGKWQYKTSSSFQDITLSSNVLLLSSTAFIRFLPNLNYNGTATISVRAWDSSSGSEGTYIETTSTSLSSNTSTVTLTINPINDNPTLVDYNWGPISELVPSTIDVSTIITNIFSDIDGPSQGLAIVVDKTYSFGNLEYTINNQTYQKIPTTGILLLDNSSNNKLRFTPIPNMVGSLVRRGIKTYYNFNYSSCYSGTGVSISSLINTVPATITGTPSLSNGVLTCNGLVISNTNTIRTISFFYKINSLQASPSIIVNSTNNISFSNNAVTLTGSFTTGSQSLDKGSFGSITSSLFDINKWQQATITISSGITGSITLFQNMNVTIAAILLYDRTIDVIDTTQNYNYLPNTLPKVTRDTIVNLKLPNIFTIKAWDKSQSSNGSIIPYNTTNTSLSSGSSVVNIILSSEAQKPSIRRTTNNITDILEDATTNQGISVEEATRYAWYFKSDELYYFNNLDITDYNVYQTGFYVSGPGKNTLTNQLNHMAPKMSDLTITNGYKLTYQNIGYYFNVPYLVPRNFVGKPITILLAFTLDIANRINPLLEFYGYTTDKLTFSITATNNLEIITPSETITSTNTIIINQQYYLILSSNGTNGLIELYKGSIIEYTKQITYPLITNNMAFTSLGKSLSMTNYGCITIQNFGIINNNTISSTSIISIVSNNNKIEINRLAGIAIYYTDIVGGNWQYSIDSGQNWVTYIQTNYKGLLLSASSQNRIRFNPTENSNGSFRTIFKAWDPSSGNEYSITTSNVGLSFTYNFPYISINSSIAPNGYIQPNVFVYGEYAIDFTNSLSYTNGNTAGFTYNTLTNYDNRTWSTVLCFGKGTPPFSIAKFSWFNCEYKNGKFALTINSIEYSFIHTYDPYSYYLWKIAFLNPGIEWVIMQRTNVDEPSIVLNTMTIPSVTGSTINYYCNFNNTCITIYNHIAIMDINLSISSLETIFTSVTTEANKIYYRAFSDEMLQLYQPVTAVNDAPTITSYINFIAVDEDSTFTINISDLMTTNLTYSDIEDATTVGLAIISADQSNGTWAISTNTGTSWTSIDTNTTTGFLVKKDTKNILRFIPNQNFAATTTINFRLWDQSEGTEGSNYTITSIGGTSGFSSTMFALSLTLIPINDSPVAVGTYTVNLTEDNITSSGVDIASIVSNLVTDVDSSTLGVAIIGLA